MIAGHAAILTALALSKMELPTPPKFGKTEVITIFEPPDPPPVPQPTPEPKQNPNQKSVIDRVPPKVPIRPLDDVAINDPAPREPTILSPLPPGPTIVPQPPARPAPPPPAPPVRIEAQIDARSELQPPYPASEERAGNEGSVTVRVQIGSDGRVAAISKVRATSDAFWRATERHALRYWRFRPATLDGKPVESSKTMTVHFQLTD